MYHECPMCGGQLEVMGTLGNHLASKCRDCGMIVTEPTEESETDETDG